MNCPWCGFTGAPRALHAHLGDAHAEQVSFEERIGRTFYGIACPICGAGYRHEIKPRGREAGFVDEFAAQIRLVAFDMLVNHLLVEHDPEATAAVTEPDETAGTAPAGPGSGPGPPPGSGPAWLTEARRQAGETGQENPD